MIIINCICFSILGNFGYFFADNFLTGGQFDEQFRQKSVQVLLKVEVGLRGQNLEEDLVQENDLLLVVQIRQVQILWYVQS
jgi:hypothetical protein